MLASAKEALLTYICPASEIGKLNKNKKRLNQIQSHTIGKNSNVESAKRDFHFK
jgi:hypothetical protein